MAEVAAIVLAAGRASRFGAGPDDSKVLATLRGTSLLAHVVRSAIESQAAPVIVVTGHAAAKAEAVLVDFTSVLVVHNPDYAEGLAGSLKTGVAALPAAIDGALILLGDMPQVTSGTLDRLIERFALDHPDAVVPTHGGRQGNPALIGRALFPGLGDLRGDAGARNVLKDPRHRVVECAVDDPGVLVDVDTPEMLVALDRPMRR